MNAVSPPVNNIGRQRLCHRLGYTFKDPGLFDLALTHRSFGAENNERLEFLGDSILNFVIGEWLFQRFSSAREGQLSRLRAQMVKGETLAEIAREFDLGPSLNLGEGELKSGGFRRESILADTVEAIIGAIYIDSGMAPARERVLAWYAERLDKLRLEGNRKDPKTELQELLQASKEPLPEYQVAEVTGEAHAQQFTVSCKISLLAEPTVASASSRRTAEKRAAAAALKKLAGKQ
ncbi:MAG: ribonuclease III [Gammaproteobacteria bacterium]|nr:ribonuclease III [Pseudomaricurvus alcaniphilus]MBR9911692.1 ribonuclease III [Gammaproteobacteria bacterium]NHN39363.1 ribonuclease III [Pseudomaricurvus alcaniphilus]